MSRPLWFALAFITLAAAVPARAQGLLEAIGEAIADSADDVEDGHEERRRPYPNNNGFNNNSRPPQYPSTHYHKVWVGDHWEYIPHTTGGISGNVIYPGGNVVSPATTVTTSVVPNALPYKGPGVTIKLEEEVGGSVNYVIDGKESAQIQAGQQQTLTSKGKYEIRFSRGKAEDGRDFGLARYTITEGNYHFTVTDKGWDLLRDKEQPNLVTTPIQSPSGIKTNALPPKSAPAPTPATPAAATPAPAGAPGSPATPAGNTLPAAKTATTAAPPPPAAGG